MPWQAARRQARQTGGLAFPQIWMNALREHGLAHSPLSDKWLEEHCLLLAAALLPLSIQGFL